MAVYYNEHDAQKAAWLRELMRRNLIAPGEVDEQSVEAIDPAELRGFTQCHFFAGIGVWSYALRSAGWSDSSPVWTGSCPCPSFSQSGKGLGFDDPRHLWPAWFRLINVCRPHVVFGEQVASLAGLAWLDVVSSDMEGAGYAIGAADLCAAGIGAPHIRQRLYFVAESAGLGRRGRRDGDSGGDGGPLQVKGRGATRIMADSCHPRSSRAGLDAQREGSQQQLGNRGREEGAAVSELADTECSGERRRGLHRSREGDEADCLGPSNQPVRGCATDLVGDSQSERRREEGPSGGRSAQRASDASQPSELGDPDSQLEGSVETLSANYLPTSPRDSFWRDAVWLPCRDGKARPVESGTFPLAHGAPARVVRLRGYGDAIVAPLAQAFIEAYQEVRCVA